MDLQPLADSCHWSETARRLVAADRRPLHVVYGNLLESSRPLSDHRTMFMLLVCDQCTILGTEKISATIDDQRRPSYDGSTSVSDLLKTTHDHQRPPIS